MLNYWLPDLIIWGGGSIVLEVIFLTTSRIKLAHARYLCRDYSIRVAKQKHYGIGYIEPRLQDREKLLAASINDAYERLKKNKLPGLDDRFFFIEDTSVIVNAISGQQEVPGVDVKYWMEENTFASIDGQLKAHGNDRSVTVRSDVVLRLPERLVRLLETEEKTKTFTSSTKGRITDHEFEISTQPLYPWLDDKSFNKWFIPDGYDRPFSLLSIEEADECDFRRGAFDEMLSFLERHASIKKRLISNNSSSEERLRELPTRSNQLWAESLLFIVCGPTCAGKTTLASYVIDHYSYYHIEASDYMHLSYYRSHGFSSSVSVADFAEKVLLVNPRVVVDQIIEHIEELENVPIFITGFRSLKEIESFDQQYKGNSTVEVIYVDADASIRFDRCKERKRPDNRRERAQFDAADRQQEEMGLRDIRQSTPETILSNDATYDEFYHEFETRYHGDLVHLTHSIHREGLADGTTHKLRDQIILSLLKRHDASEYFTTTQIARLINDDFYAGKNKKSKNNVSRYFNQDSYPYFDVQMKDGRKRYRLSQTGVARAKWLLRR